MNYQTVEKGEVVLSQNTTSYPITLDEVKQWCNINLANTSKDFIIQSKIIPVVVNDWECMTKFYLLDTSLKATLGKDYIHFSKVRLESLNLRDITEIQYYPSNYSVGDTVSTLDLSTDIDIESEMGYSSTKVHYINGVLSLYCVYQSRLTISYNAGYLNNDFTSIPNDIKNALLEMACNKFSLEIGLCKNSTDFIRSAKKKYSIDNDSESIYYKTVITFFDSGLL